MARNSRSKKRTAGSYFLVAMICAFSLSMFSCGKPDFVFAASPDSKKETLFLKSFEDVRNDYISEGKSFLEINLPQKQTNIYKNGELTDSVPIYNIGDPQGWGGIAAGLCKTAAKKELSFSLKENVFLPYTVNYYGNYYLHGTPYSLKGENRYSKHSLGSVQLKKDDAEVVFNKVEKGMAVVVIDRLKDNYQYPKPVSVFPAIAAKSYLVADLDSGYVIAEKNAQTLLPIASLTKLMTAVVISEQVDPARKITIDKTMLLPYGFTKTLAAGVRFSLSQLFGPILQESSNDAAEAASYFLGKKRTIQLMNEKARAILMTNTKFADVHGLSENNVSTAANLFYLARYVANNKPILFDITKGTDVSSKELPVIASSENKNLFINFPDFIGGKTGYILESKYNGVFIFRLPQASGKTRRIAIILLGSPNWMAGYGNLKGNVLKIRAWLLQNYTVSK